MPLQPICILCLSDCDAGGCLSTCSHFFCSRCLARLPPAGTAPCPICRKAYRLAPLSTPSIRPLFDDPADMLAKSSKVLANQVFHHQQITMRMREALRLFNTKFRASEKQLAERTEELVRAQQKLHQADEYVAKQRAELLALHAQNQQAQLPRPMPSPRGFPQQGPYAVDDVSAPPPPGRSSSLVLSSPYRPSSVRGGAGCTAGDDTQSRYQSSQHQQQGVSLSQWSGGGLVTPMHPSLSPSRHSTLSAPPVSSCPMPSEGSGRHSSPLGWSSTSNVLKRPRATSSARSTPSTGRDPRESGSSETLRRRAETTGFTTNGSARLTPSHHMAPPSPSGSSIFMTPGTCAVALQQQRQQGTSMTGGQQTFRLSTPLVNSLSHAQQRQGGRPSQPQPSLAAAPTSLHTLLSMPRESK